MANNISAFLQGTELMGVKRNMNMYTFTYNSPDEINKTYLTNQILRHNLRKKKRTDVLQRLCINLII